MQLFDIFPYSDPLSLWKVWPSLAHIVSSKMGKTGDSLDFQTERRAKATQNWEFFAVTITTASDSRERPNPTPNCLGEDYDLAQAQRKRKTPSNLF